MALLGPEKLVAVLIALSGTALSVGPAAYGCAYHNVIPDAQLNGIYPGSLSVAVALRQAADAGRINAAALEAQRGGAVLYIDAVTRLQNLRKALAASPAASGLPARFSLGYVESGLWTRYAQSDGAIAIQIHTTGPAEGEPVVLTGEPVVMALLDGSLSLDDALAGGLVVIVAAEPEAASLRQALAAATGPDRVGVN